MDRELRRLIKNKATVNNKVIPKLDYRAMLFLEEVAEIAIKYHKETNK